MTRVVIVFILTFNYTTSVIAGDITIRPKPAVGPLDNPLKGWCPYTNAGEIHHPYSMVFKYISWRELEPTKGEYRFEDWEKTWNEKAADGKHIIFRVYIDYPTQPSGLPEWMRKAGVKETPYKEHGGGIAPNYDDPRMIAGMERLIAELGKRYNNHPRIAFIQLGLLGFWGEWHTWPRVKLYASLDTERRIINAYRKAFPEKCLMVRYSRNYAGQQNWIGYHDDMFPQDTDNGKDWSFLADLRKTNRIENWKVAVVGGEMVPGKATKWLGSDYQITLTMLERAHFSWVGPYCPALEKPKDTKFHLRCGELVRKMGYEFQLTEIAHPKIVTLMQPARITLKGRNQGVAPFYYPWPVEWALIDSAGKVAGTFKTNWEIRSWKPGTFSEETNLTLDVPPGEYQLAIGIRDPWTKQPRIRFANDLKVFNGWTVVSRIEVLGNDLN